MKRRFISQHGESKLEDRSDAAAVRGFLKDPSETFPDAVVGSILDGAHPIKAFREYRGLTQAQLAGKVGTTAVYISQIERGDRRAGRKLQPKIGAALGVEAAVLERHES